MDCLTTKQRSYNMSRIRGCNTAPEIRVRSILHRLGFRFTISSRQNKRLPGKPDIILPKYRRCVFVHGCFWHAHSGCPSFKMPATRTEWWSEKLIGNRDRDDCNFAQLIDMGWRVLVVWECTLKNNHNHALERLLEKGIKAADRCLEISNCDGCGCSISSLIARNQTRQ